MTDFAEADGLYEDGNTPVDLGVYAAPDVRAKLLLPWHGLGSLANAVNLLLEWLAGKRGLLLTGRVWRFSDRFVLVLAASALLLQMESFLRWQRQWQPDTAAK